jgi:hypothetical protein
LLVNPDVLMDGNVIAADAGLGSHAEVTRAFAELGDAFEAAGIARPWLEGPRGRTISAEVATVLKTH